MYHFPGCGAVYARVRLLPQDLDVRIGYGLGNFFCGYVRRLLCLCVVGDLGCARCVAMGGDEMISVQEAEEGSELEAFGFFLGFMSRPYPLRTSRAAL